MQMYNTLLIIALKGYHFKIEQKVCPLLLYFINFAATYLWSSVIITEQNTYL